MPTPKGQIQTPKASTIIKPKGFCGVVPLSVIIYGPPGVGKTSFAANFPRPGFIRAPREEGISILLTFNKVTKPIFIEEAETFTGLIDQCNEVANGKKGIETLVIDSLSEFELMCYSFHAAEHNEGKLNKEGFYAFGQGPKEAAAQSWPPFIDALDNVRAEGISVVLIAHSQVKPRPNPTGADYIAYYPKLEAALWERTHTWAQCVLFYNYSVTTAKDNLRIKADPTSDNRFIYTEFSAVATAKNWYGLEPVLDAGTSGKSAFEAFKKAFLKCVPKS